MKTIYTNLLDWMDPHQILDIYFRDHFYPFTKHHIDSYREFLRRYIPDVIRSYNPITMVKFRNNNKKDIELKVDIFIGDETGDKIYIDRPTLIDPEGNPVLMTPQDARLKNLTYSTRLYSDVMVRYTLADKEQPIEKRFSHILLGEIPLMIHSDGCVLHQQGPKVLQAFNECPFDQGGYFIIDGKEKVVISQERMVTNRLFIEKAKDPRYSHKGWVRCTTETGEAALLPKTIEFYIMDPNANKSSLREDTSMNMEQGKDKDMEDDEEIEDKKTISTRIKYRGAIVVSLPNIRDSSAGGIKIPLFHLFRALGVESDREILEYIFGDTTKMPQEYIDFITPSIRHCADEKINIFSQTDAIEGLKNYVRYKSNEHVHHIITQDVFPNMGVDYKAKARFLGYLIRYMMEMILKVRPPADRDGYGFKRIDLSGFLLSQLFHNIYKLFRKHCRDLLDQEYHYGPTKNTGHYEDLIRKENIQKIISPSYITERMKRSLKGLWGSTDDDEKQEKVQDLSRISYIGFLSNLRRVNTPLDRSIKITSPHRLNAQQWGIICPFESPDGASIGYLKNFALLAHVSFGTDPMDLMKEPDNCLRELGLIPLALMTSVVANEITKVFLNGQWIGGHIEPNIFTYQLRLLRRNGLINAFTSIAWKINQNEIRIQTDPGRACRPLIIVNDTNVNVPEYNEKLLWFDLLFGTLLPKSEKIEELYYKSSYKSPFNLKEFVGLSKDEIFKRLEKTQGVIEFVDIEEEDTRLIAMYKKDINAFITHLEIHPSTILSVVSNNIPLANHNQAPRNIFYGAQSKQAIGVYASNFSKRFDTMSYILHYPERPIITTQNSHYISNDKLPAGANTIVAIMTNTGYNQEDGVIINKSSIDRGFFQTTSYKSYSAQESSKQKNQYTMFTNPLKLRDNQKIDVQNMKDDSNYQLLDENGIVLPESFVAKGSKVALIGMVEVKEELKEIRKGVKVETKVVKTYRNTSVVSGVHHYGVVDKIYLDHTGLADDHNRICKMRFRKMKRPELGDKTCSRHGQKGVMGMIIPREDMPFTKDGIVPDIIINPHAIPSRMTIGHLVECIFAKACTMEGTVGDGSVFIPLDRAKIGDTLESHDFERYGNEVLYNGRTGDQIESDIFIGPTFYLRLKHMVGDKMHHRDKGPKDQLTQQPTSGRGKEGGLRIGEMERDVLLSYGFSQFAKESVMERSDKYTWGVCRSCGRTAKYTPSMGIYECTICKGSDIAAVQTPFAFKLLCHELETMGITPRFVMDSVEEEKEISLDEMENEIFEQEKVALMDGGIINDDMPYNSEEECDDEECDNEEEGGDSEEYDENDEGEEEDEGEEKNEGEVNKEGEVNNLFDDEEEESLMDEGDVSYLMDEGNISSLKNNELEEDFKLNTEFSASEDDEQEVPSIISQNPIAAPTGGVKIIEIADSKWMQKDKKTSSKFENEDVYEEFEDNFDE